MEKVLSKIEAHRGSTSLRNPIGRQDWGGLAARTSTRWPESLCLRPFPKRKQSKAGALTVYCDHHVTIKMFGPLGVMSSERPTKCDETEDEMRLAHCLEVEPPHWAARAARGRHPGCKNSEAAENTCTSSTFSISTA